MVVPINQYFDVFYGANLELVHLTLDPKGINFVARTSENNGVVARVKVMPDIKPNPPNTISVSAGGSVMESFLQKEPYYSGRDLFCLQPKIELSDKQLLYYCMCLKANKFKFNYNRQANKTLPDLSIPSIDEIPKWVEAVQIPNKPKIDSIAKNILKLNIENWGGFQFGYIFDDIEIARSIDLNKLKIAVGNIEGVNYVGRTYENNGITAKVLKQDNAEGFINEGNCIVVPMVGDSTCFALYQNSPFYASQNILTLRSSKLNVFNALFISTIIELERFRFSYGRTLTKNYVVKHRIKLPSIDNKIDWQFMEDYIKSLPYSSNI